VPGFTDKPLDVPIPSAWKIEDGKWMWYVEQKIRSGSPMGLTMSPGPAVYSAQSNPDTHALPAIPSTPDFLYSLIKVEKSDVEVKRGESAQVTIENTSPGTMSLELAGKITGVEATLDNPNPKGKEKATLTLKAGKNAESGSLDIVVNPISQVIPIHVTVMK
jgi:hypothetical protein